MKKPRIVLLGGGTGQSVLLAGLAGRACELTAIVGVTDNGGHTGTLRRDLGLPAVGDLRQCLGSIAGDGVWGRLLRYRFGAGSGALDGVSLGNLVLAGLTLEHGGLSAAASELNRALALPARVLPVADGSAQVCARLADGRTILGEWEILERAPRTPIRRVCHRPALRATPEVCRALRGADLAVLCPGSLFTGVASVLSARGVKAALARVPVLAVINVMTQPGQTDGMGWREHLAALELHLGKTPEIVLLNTAPPPRRLVRAYARLGATPVATRADGAEVAATAKAAGTGAAAPRVLRAALVEQPAAQRLRGYLRSGKHLKSWPHLIRHDARRLAAAVLAEARRVARAGRRR
ncbi:MAG: YvcK family protein [Planctomycetes bacterium]|nr:YvcK family protein [Planctomycetota bacterium]